MAIEKPTITHKYITLFNTEAEYTEAYPEFSEANWSDVGYPENTPDNYRLSRRLSNMYHKNTPPDYKFDSINDFVTEQKEELKKDSDGNWHIVYEDIDIYPDAYKTANFRLSDYTDECIKKAFFLEVVWGYSGWEWVDYRRVLEDETEETLTGGNMYEVKNIVIVPHIIDGDRLYHINDFLNSQDNVTTVLGFNTENLVAANRAFKRRTESTHLANFLNLTLADSYNERGVLSDRFFGYGNTLANLEEADELFRNTKVTIDSNVDESEKYINMPKIKHIDRLLSCGVYTGIKFKMESLEELTGAFALTTFTNRVIDVNSIFLGDTLNHVKDLNHLFYAAYFNAQVSGEEGDTELKTIVNLDLTDSEVSEDDIIDLNYLLAWCGPKNYTYMFYGIIANSTLEVNLNFSHNVTLNYAFSNINRGNHHHNPIDKSYSNREYLWNAGFEKIHLNLNGKEQYVRSITWGFSSTDSKNPCIYTETIPMIQVPNNDCDDTKLYGNCTFNVDVTYDFLNGPIETPRAGYGQFNGCTFNVGCHFLNLPGLDRVELCGISFGENVSAEDRILPIVQNQEDHTYRYFDIRGSKFTDIQAQNIYINTARFRTASDKSGGAGERINPFADCSQVTDLSNINLYYSDVDERVEVLVPWDNHFTLDFRHCTSITKTPHIYLNYYRNRYQYFYIYFTGLTNLVEVNFEDLTIIGAQGSSTSTHSFKDCTNLVDLKIATNTEAGFQAQLDIRGCVNLNPTTLRATLMKIRSGRVQMLRSTWEEKLDDTTRDYLKARVIYTITDDESYFGLSN